MIENKLYPLKFSPIYIDKVWGGRALEKCGRVLPGGKDKLIGESWELADLRQTSTSGAGGGAEHSVVSNGPFKGETITELTKQFGESILGHVPLSSEGGFPLLVKILDAEDNLSVQVHPNQVYANTHKNAFLKSECWYVLYAEPNAVIYKGVKDGVTDEEFRKAIADNTVEDLLISVPVKVGDCHYIPSGTCHSLGKGIVAAEVQTPSDTTFRVYDWGRVGRELHIEQAMECIKLGPPDVTRSELNLTIEGEHAFRTQLIECRHYKLDRYVAKHDYEDIANEPETRRLDDY